MNYSNLSFLIQRDRFMYHKLTQSLTFSPAGFSLGRPDPTSDSERQNTRGFSFLRFFRDLTWFSLLALNSLVNERTSKTYGFYVSKKNSLTIFERQPSILIFKEQVSVRDSVLYRILCRNPLNFRGKLKKESTSINLSY